MATFLDTSLLQSFDIIFPFLLVFAITFAILAKTGALGKDVLAINAIVAASTAFLVILSDPLVQMIKFMVPWFVIAFIFFMLLLLIFQIFGATEKDIFKYIQTDKGVGWVIVGVGIIILFAAIGNVLGQSIGPYLDEGSNATAVQGSSGVATGNFQTNITATLFHPKVIGLIILFVVMIFAVALLTGSTK